MKKNDNSVNIKNATLRYHHGDLRAALVAAGLDLLKNRAADALSLREVARVVGVSATAVYRHFPDKKALLYALCSEGAEALGRAQEEAMRAAAGGVAGFDATGRAYVRFALAHPALYRLMMSVHPSREMMGGEATAISGAMRLLLDNVAELLPSGSTEHERRLAAIHAWCLVHGMAMLMLDGQVPADEATIESICGTTLM